MQRKALHKTHKHALKQHTNMAGPSHKLLETYTHVVQIQSTCFHNCFNIARYRSHCLQTVPPVAREINTFQGCHPSAQVIILNTHNISATTRRLSIRRTADSSPSRHICENFPRQHTNKQLQFQNNNRTTEDQPTRRAHYGECSPKT